MKIVLTIVIFLVYSFFAMKQYLCNHKEVCASSDRTELVQPATLSGPVAVLWNSPNLLTDTTGNNLDSYIQKWSSGMDDGKLLVITGLYHGEEQNPTTEENLGMARAQSGRALFAGIVPEERIRLKAAEVPEESGERDHAFDGIEISYEDVNIERAEVVKLTDKVVILFPYNSANPQSNESVNAYLDQLADRLKEDPAKKVRITGHADSTGSSSNNIKIGERRANTIKNILVEKKGVPEKQIITKSLGESEPVASNDSEEGRHQNRRVEIKIIQ